MDTRWIAVDWGTTHLRAWAMGPDGTVLDSASSDKGMGGLTPSEFEPALLSLVEDWLASDKTIPVIACGMVGARQGWVEAPYAQAPCPPLSPNLIQPPVSDSRISVHIVPGVMQRDPADVMRGEETQIAGFLADKPDYDGVICLPGTHSKWVRVEGGKIVAFKTFMTGEMFALLSQQSVLRHSVGQGWDAPAFLVGVSLAHAEPERIAGQLFSLRAESLVAGLAPDAARARLSGLLIGAELAATTELRQGVSVTIIGAGTLSGLYARALAALSQVVRNVDGGALALAGLTAAYALKGNAP